MMGSRAESTSAKSTKSAEVLRQLRNMMVKKMERKLDFLYEKAMSRYSCGTVLSPLELRHELRDCYYLLLLGAPMHSDGCNKNFSFSFFGMQNLRLSNALQR